MDIIPVIYLILTWKIWSHLKTDLIALKKKSSQANTTPRSETQVFLELEETQAEIVGPAEIFLR